MSYRYDGNGNFSTDQPNKSRQTGQPSPEKPTNSDMGSWIFIVIMFAVAWPIGLILLISKLDEGSTKKKIATKVKAGAASKSAVKAAANSVTKTPKDSAKGARAMKIVGIVLVALGALAGLALLPELLYCLTQGLWWELISDLSAVAAFWAGGCGLLWGSRQMKRRMRRFAKYLAVAGAAQSVSLSRLAAAAEVSAHRVERDLELMIEKGMWGNGAYVDLSAGKLFRDAQAGAKHYEQKSAPVVPPQAQQGYSGMLRQLRAANDRIADAGLSAKIDRLEEIAGRIFRIIEEEPAKKAKAATFLNYYLPTTQKLLDAYAEFEEAGVSGGNMSQAKRKIEQTMDGIVLGFERQLDELYRTDAMDIDSDIRVMETMLRRDTARVEDDFRVQTSGGAVTDDFAAPDEGRE